MTEDESYQTIRRVLGSLTYDSGAELAHLDPEENDLAHESR
jgi:hypothetical protein